MRISFSTLMDTSTRNLQAGEQRLKLLQDQLASGKRIRRPSDDPIGASLALTLRTRRAQLDQLDRNLGAASDWLKASDTQLSEMTSVLQRAKELAVQGGTDTVGSTERARVADELEQILRHTVQIGNATMGGRYLFAGAKTDTQPFALTIGPPTSVSYAGDSGDLKLHVDVGVDLPVNTAGSKGFPNVYSALSGLVDDLRAGIAPSSSRMAAMNTALDDTVALQAEVGAKLSRLDSISTRTDDDRLNIASQLSEIEDTDVVDVTMRLKAQENVYQAAIAVGARVIQPSLLDFLKP